MKTESEAYEYGQYYIKGKIDYVKKLCVQVARITISSQLNVEMWDRNNAILLQLKRNNKYNPQESRSQ